MIQILNILRELCLYAPINLDSEDIAFYLINPMLMIIDVFTVSISIRFLHFTYACALFAMYDLIHVYRWVGGSKPSHDIFYFGDLPAVTSIMFLFVNMVLVIPFVHLIAYGIDSLRASLIAKMRARNRHKVLSTANSSSPIIAPSKTPGQQSSIRYKTSAFQKKRLTDPTSSQRSRRNVKLREGSRSSTRQERVTKMEKTRTLTPIPSRQSA